MDRNNLIPVDQPYKLFNENCESSGDEADEACVLSEGYVRKKLDVLVKGSDTKADGLFSIISKTNSNFLVKILNFKITDSQRLIPTCSTASADCNFSTIDLLEWASQVVHGMQHLESRNIVHGDLAARNILLCDNGAVKICDFGLSRLLQRDGIYWKKGQVSILFWFLFI